MSKLSIRHRLNIIVAILIALVVMTLGVIGNNVHTATVDTSQQQRRLAQLQTIWPVVATAARAPDTIEDVRTLALETLATVADDPAMKPIAPLLREFTGKDTTRSVLERAADDMPKIAFYMLGDTGAARDELELMQLLSVQIPEFVWRLATLRENALELAARESLGPGDRMLFLVNAGQFKATADAIDGYLRTLARGDAELPLGVSALRFGKANNAFQSAAARLAWTINTAEAENRLDPDELERAYAGFVGAAMAVWQSAFDHVSAHVATRLDERLTMIVAAAVLALVFTILALSLTLSLSGSIVRAIGRLEKAIYTLADSDDADQRTTKLPDADGRSELARIARAVAYYRDRVRDRIADALQDEKRRELELLFEKNPVPMIIRDPSSDRILNVNRTAVRHYGYSLADFQAMQLGDLAAKPAKTDTGCEEYSETQVHRHRKANGEEIEVIIFERTIRLDHQDVRFAAIVDITERRRAETRLAYLAHYDVLTGLANRVLLHKHLAEEIQRGADDPDKAFALLCIDLDRFKNVNDTLGHAAGDDILKNVASRLGKLVGSDDIVARLGGDEFTILLRNADREVAGALAQAVCETLAQPFTAHGAQVNLGASVGIGHFPADGADNDTLMKHADLALNCAKAEGRGRYRVFEPALDEELRRRQALEIALRAALDHDRFELHYQPLVNIDSNTVSGFEALLRWHDPDRGLVPPGEFIPIAEEVGLIEEIGTWVLREACREVASWENRVKVAVNVSSYQFRDGRLVNVVRDALAETGLEPGRLELEITESVLLEDSKATFDTLHRIRALGVRIAMDDFGTGYSSLSYLRAFPFDKVKIDRSFVSDLGNAAQADAIVRAIAGLSRELGMMTTAEGIETEDQFRHIAELRCTEAQGFLTGRPAPAAIARGLAAGQTEALRQILQRMKARCASEEGVAQAKRR